MGYGILIAAIVRLCVVMFFAGGICGMLTVLGEVKRGEPIEIDHKIYRAREVEVSK